MTPRSRSFAIGLILALGSAAVPRLQADPNSPITITDVDSPDPVSSGAPLTHTITIVNTGGSKLTNLVFTDQLQGIQGMGVPPQLQLASSRGSCIQSGDLVTCSTSQIEGNGSWTISIRGLVTAPNGTMLNNTVQVTGTRSAQNFTTTHTETTLVGSGGGSALPDLTIDKTGPTSVAINGDMTYTLTVNNKGGTNATDIMAVDTVPAQLSNISAVGTSLFVCNVVGHTVTCTGGAVNAGANATITIQADTPAAVPLPPDNTMTNTAVVDPENSIPEGDELNNTSALVNTTLVATVPVPPLSISVEDNVDPVIPGGGVTYTLFVVNNAATRADDVQIVMGTQGLEASSIVVGMDVVNGTIGNSGGCSAAASETQCRVRTLNPGGTVTMHVSGFVIGFAGSGVIATGTVTGNIRNTGYSSTDIELTTIKPFIDLTITKIDTPDPLCARSFPGPPLPAVPPFPAPVCLGGLTYTYTVGNSGIGTATNVVVRDPLPPGTIYDSSSLGGACSVDPANVLTCTIASLPPGITTFTVTLVGPPGIGTIQNIVTVDPYNAIFEADETNNTATAITTVTTGIDLVVDKTDFFDPIATSGTETYTILIDNIGPQDATNIRVRDTLPSGTIFRDVVEQTNGFTCAYTAGTHSLECIGGSIRGTQSEYYGHPPSLDRATIKFRIFAQTFEGTMHNEVRVDPNNEIPEINEANNFEFEDTAVQRGGVGTGAFNELTIDKTQVSPNDPVARNALTTFNLAIGNDGSDPVVNVHVRDFLPAGSRYVQATGGGNFHCTEANNIVDCTGGNIAAGGTVNITVKIFAPDTPGTYINQAIADPNDTIPEGNEFNNQDSEEITVENDGNGAFNDLSITKLDTPDPVTPKGQITYTLTVMNDGTDPALNVKVRDVLPEGVTFVSADDAAPGLPGAFTCGESALTVTCVGATVGGGGGVRAITIIVKAPNVTGATLTNQAVVDPENEIPEGDEENNTAEAETTVTSNVNLSITKTGPQTSSQSQVTDYKLTIENHSPSGGSSGQTAFNVEVHDPLPVGVIPLAVDTGSGNNFTCQVAENPINVVDCVGDLDPDAPVTITITVFMTAESSRSLDNEACIDPNDLIAEFAPPGETDNCSTHSNPVGPPPKRSPDLLVSKSVSAAQASPGDTLTYVITVSNIGDAKHKGTLTVTDNLPNDTLAVGITGPNLWTCSAPADIMTCNIPASPNDEIEPGGSVQFTVTATVKPTASQPLVNTASATGGLADPAEADAENEPAAKLANNTATAKTTVGSANIDLSIGAITDNPDPVFPGQPVKYTIVAVNGGGTDVNNALIRLTMPAAGTSFVGADGTNGVNCAAPVGTTVDCQGNLPAGGDTVITLTLQTLLAPPGDLTVSAAIDPNNVVAEDHEDNNTDSETTTVSGTICIGCVDLVSALLVASPEPVASGGTVTFKYVLINAGDQPTALAPTQQIAFFDFFGNHTSFSISTNNPAITCTPLPHGPTPPFPSQLNDCFGNLGPGQGVTITATVGGVTGDAINAFATADPTFAIIEVNEGNNALAESVDIN